MKEENKQPSRQQKKRKRLPPHWYKIEITECVLCGAGETHRVRMFTPKPDDPSDRYDYTQFACDVHFF